MPLLAHGEAGVVPPGCRTGHNASRSERYDRRACQHQRLSKFYKVRF